MNTLPYDEYEKLWMAWYRSAVEQFEQENPDWSGGHCEVCEDGSVYLGNMAWFPAGTVEPLPGHLQ